jgi:excisionase family DNA binding protein
MSIAARVPTTPRYGSPAEVASYAGLSTKTIRRLVEAGRVPGHKVGRRLVIPFEAVDRMILSAGERPRPAPAASRRLIDDRGRALPLNGDQLRERALAVAEGLDALDEMGDELEQRQTLDALMGALAEGRGSDPTSD